MVVIGGSATIVKSGSATIDNGDTNTNDNNGSAAIVIVLVLLQWLMVVHWC